MPAFQIKDCTLAVMALGIRAQTLAEFRDRLQTIPPSSLFFHFWANRLRTAFEPREHRNDFAHWAHHSLHDDVLAERLEMIDPVEHRNVESFRAEIIDVVENRLDEREMVPWARHDDQFHFERAKIVVFDTKHEIPEPKDLVQVIPMITHSSLFFHFIDARRRSETRQDDFSLWLQGFGTQYEQLVNELKRIDPYFISLTDLQHRLTLMMTNYFIERELEHPKL